MKFYTANQVTKLTDEQLEAYKFDLCGHYAFVVEEVKHRREKK